MTTDERAALRAQVERLRGTGWGYNEAIRDVLALLDAGKAAPDPPADGKWYPPPETWLSGHRSSPSDARERLNVLREDVDAIGSTANAAVLNAREALDQVAALTERVSMFEKNEVLHRIELLEQWRFNMTQRAAPSGDTPCTSFVIPAALRAQVEKLKSGIADGTVGERVVNAILAMIREDREAYHDGTVRSIEIRQQATERAVAALENVVHQMGPPFVERAAPSGDTAQDHGGTEAAIIKEVMCNDAARPTVRADAVPEGRDSVNNAPSSPAPIPESSPTVWPSERARDVFVDTPGYDPLFADLEAAYAVDVPAIEAAAFERGATALAAHLGDWFRNADRRTIRATEVGYDSLAARFLAERRKGGTDG